MYKKMITRITVIMMVCFLFSAFTVIKTHDAIAASKEQIHDKAENILDRPHLGSIAKSLRQIYKEGWYKTQSTILNAVKGDECKFVIEKLLKPLMNDLEELRRMTKDVDPQMYDRVTHFTTRTRVDYKYAEVSLSEMINGDWIEASGISDEDLGTWIEYMIGMVISIMHMR
jgi:hypothetical protein